MASEIKLFNMDCIEAMKNMPNKLFDLAIVDPPYGDTVVSGGYKTGQGGNGAARQKKYNNAVWSTVSPDQEYFYQLLRVSKEQIVWGGNHLISRIGLDSSCWIVWDKNNTGRFADAELAWTSFKTAVRIFKYTWNGMIQEKMNNKEDRIHPTQKPVDLYAWILRNYAPPKPKFWIRTWVRVP